MAKKTVDDLTNRISNLREKAQALSDDATLQARRTAKKAVRRAQRKLKTSKALEAARAPKSAGKKAGDEA